MTLLPIIFACVVMKAQMLFCHGSLVDLTSSEFDGFVNTMDTRVVYFETKGTVHNTRLMSCFFASSHIKIVFLYSQILRLNFICLEKSMPQQLKV